MHTGFKYCSGYHKLSFFSFSRSFCLKKVSEAVLHNSENDHFSLWRFSETCVSYSSFNSFHYWCDSSWLLNFQVSGLLQTLISTQSNRCHCWFWQFWFVLTSWKILTVWNVLVSVGCTLVFLSVSYMCMSFYFSYLRRTHEEMTT